MARNIPYYCEICKIPLADSRPSLIKRHEASKNHIKNQKTKATEEQLELQKKRTKDDKKHYEENKEEIAKRGKKYREENKEEIAEYQKKYNQTPQGIETKLKSTWRSRGVKGDLDEIYMLYVNTTHCEYCSIEFGEIGDGEGSWKCLDHCHQTGEFRGVLCNNCNVTDMLNSSSI